MYIATRTSSHMDLQVQSHDIQLLYNELYNLSFGIRLKKEVQDLLNIWDSAKVQADKFLEK